MIALLSCAWSMPLAAAPPCACASWSSCWRGRAVDVADQQVVLGEVADGALEAVEAGQRVARALGDVDGAVQRVVVVRNEQGAVADRREGLAVLALEEVVALVAAGLAGVAALGDRRLELAVVLRLDVADDGRLRPARARHLDAGHGEAGLAAEPGLDVVLEADALAARVGLRELGLELGLDLGPAGEARGERLRLLPGVRALVDVGVDVDEAGRREEPGGPCRPSRQHRRRHRRPSSRRRRRGRGRAAPAR